MNEKVEQRLRDALDACGLIQSFTEGVEFEAYLVIRLVSSAVERQLEIVGEALNRALRIDDQLEIWIPDAQKIIGTRNRIIHGYNVIDDRIIWDAIRSKVPSLLADLNRLLGSDAVDRVS